MTTQKNSKPGANSPEPSAPASLRTQRPPAGETGAAELKSTTSSDNRSLFQRVYNDAWQRVGDAYEQIEQTVVENPKTSMAIPFALGVGIGMLIGLSVTGRASHRRRRNDWFGRQYLDSLADRLPDSIGQRLHS